MKNFRIKILLVFTCLQIVGMFLLASVVLAVPCDTACVYNSWDDCCIVDPHPPYACSGCFKEVSCVWYPNQPPGCNTGSCSVAACTGGSSCFLPGTKISMADGSKKNIEEVKVGEKVLSFDPQTQKLTTSVIQKNYARATDSYYEIKTKSGKVLRVTGEHPLFVGFESEIPKTFGEKLAKFLIPKMAYLRNKFFGVRDLFAAN